MFGISGPFIFSKSLIKRGVYMINDVLDETGKKM
jgi:hypothetical protein